MEYSLAKKLKEAGFPQVLGGKWVGENAVVYTNPPIEPVGYAYLPTLSELIEACGEGFYSLTRSVDDGEVYWWASSIELKIREFDADTREEAVARLWLSLNQK